MKRYQKWEPQLVGKLCLSEYRSRDQQKGCHQEKQWEQERAEEISKTLLCL